MGYADYVKNTAGSQGGQMLIRVADSAGQSGVISADRVQFFVRSGLTSTFVGSPGFATSVYYNGQWVGLNNVANYSGSTAWRQVGEIHVTYNQTITFHINSSGTSGFGGPDDFAVAISRAVVPAAPTPVGIDEIQHQTFRYQFSGNWDGGSGMLEWQIGYGYDANNVQWTAPSNGTITVGTFVVGATIYIWSRGRNAVGWGPWSARSSVVLKQGCRIKHQGVWAYAIPHVKHGMVAGGSSGSWKPAEPYYKKGKVPGVSWGTWELVPYQA